MSIDISYRMAVAFKYIKILTIFLFCWLDKNLMPDSPLYLFSFFFCILPTHEC